eukprot:CAMPEP_0185847842 /NCGR_PEP_ID=MMETSP1354-20130828/2950_1 /TAXON_ID=708628 /ORGANISM="Erythrolobus madagascarensis, Strain CCMP3276" /LENGTH=185 /DNA_ID=CAMNT_0028548173 /DNA_START=43 /DNA_END=600 /DNA_ORIENTATION=+
MVVGFVGLRAGGSVGEGLRGVRANVCDATTARSRKFGVVRVKLASGGNGSSSSVAEEKTEGEATVVPTVEDMVGIFQLDELEDKDSMCTAVVLNADGTASCGKTDGPVPVSVKGAWTLEGAEFVMRLVREFEAESGGRYTISSEYVGDAKKNLTYIEIDGVINQKYPKVGYFKLFSADDGATSVN